MISHALAQFFQGARHAGRDLVNQRHYLGGNRRNGSNVGRFAPRLGQVQKAFLVGGERAGGPNRLDVHSQILAREVQS